MLSALFWLLIGLMVGWFFLPTPLWATALFAVIIAKVPFLAKYVKK